MKRDIGFLTLTTLMVATAAAACGQSESFYLFDCSGEVQRLGGDSISVQARRTVSEIDASLPSPVRDGCAILTGWYARTLERLVLDVQTRAIADTMGRIPTRWILVTPDLELDTSATAPAQPRRGRAEIGEVRSQLGSMDLPFAKSVAYVLEDGTTALLRELSAESARRLPLTVSSQWRVGDMSLNRGREDGTGRYALIEIATGALRGEVVSATGDVTDQRLVCFTPGGRIFLTAARDTLLVLDAMDPNRRSLVAVSGMDLYWTACAWGR